MEIHQIESWALNVIDRVVNGQPNEDARVELKSEWSRDYAKIARRIAGHANVARGAPILWLIGVDEKGKKVTGATIEDVANWYPQVEKQFDGLAPDLIDINIPYQDKTVVALYFETTRRPFVVKNANGGAASLEVPWRTGTRVHSARREELIRLLSPLQSVPGFEVMQASLTFYAASSTKEWSLDATLYVEASGKTPIYIPFHRCQASLYLGNQDTILLKDFRLTPPQGRSDYSRTIEGTKTEVIILGPGLLRLTANAITPQGYSVSIQPTMRVKVSIRPLRSETSIPIDIALNREHSSGNPHTWSFDTGKLSFEKALLW